MIFHLQSMIQEKVEEEDKFRAKKAVMEANREQRQKHRNQPQEHSQQPENTDTVKNGNHGKVKFLYRGTIFVTVPTQLEGGIW